MKNQFNFSGYATKFNVKCSDGRTIKPSAFQHQDGQVIPLVWQHMHNDPMNVLGHAVLQHRDDGVYAYCYLNDTDSGKQAKVLVEHGDISSLSIHANKLKQQGDAVLHGMIRELSLVLSGANPDALIDNISFQHSDGTIEVDETEAIIYHGQEIKMEDDKDDDSEIEHADSEKTVQDVFNTLNEEQKNVVYAMIAQAIGGDEEDETISQGGIDMKQNVFEKQNGGVDKKSLSHTDLQAIVTNAQKCGSFKEAFLSHVQTYGIENIDYLFPDARTITPTPDMISRRMEWVPGVLGGARKSPFSRIKSVAADITEEEARALGYVKGSLKKEEVIKLLKRITTPTTIYKKQKLDRDDMIDITDLDVVAWLKSEMRMMLDEEIARAVLVGDGRDPASEDKIIEENIRPIYKDDDMYSHKIELEAADTTEDIIEAIIRSMEHYKGSGSPTLYTTTTQLTDMLLLKDTLGRRLYTNVTELASALRVSNIVEVPVMSGVSRENDEMDVLNLVGIVVNMRDYVMGADKGGQVSMFDDFDIDYNQYKYLIETRMSGCLTKPKSAIIIEKKNA